RARGASARAAPPLRSDPGRACLASMPRAPPTRLPTASCSCVTPSADHTRPAQEGHTPRDLLEKGTSTSARQVILAAGEGLARRGAARVARTGLALHL